ncbi:MAG: PHP domain-containing protein [Acidobacteriota bacterium]
MTRPRYDLHTHTTASDGRLSPRELVREAQRSQLRALAITDHDTVEGIDEAWREAETVGLDLISGIEVSANCDGASVHVLGLYIRHDEPWLKEFLSQARERRLERIHRILQKLSGEGIHIGPEEVSARSAHGTIGRPHVAEVLVERGVVADAAEAFARYLGYGAPAYVGYEKITLRDAIELIRRAGGVASLAHPGLLERDDLIPGMVDEGLQAIEVYHCDHSAETVSHYRQLASRFGLLTTGGSDFHARDGKGSTELGCAELTEEALERIRRLASSTS